VNTQLHDSTNLPTAGRHTFHKKLNGF